MTCCCNSSIFQRKVDQVQQKDDGFGRFHKAMGHNIEGCEEF
jgi:hypothetical protein